MVLSTVIKLSMDPNILLYNFTYSNDTDSDDFSIQIS